MDKSEIKLNNKLNRSKQSAPKVLKSCSVSFKHALVVQKGLAMEMAIAMEMVLEVVMDHAAVIRNIKENFV